MPNKIGVYCIAISALSVTLIIAGCSEIYRQTSTEFEPTKAENGYQHFQYKVETCGGVNQPDDKSAEKERIQWLKRWLAINGYNNAEYEIVSRQVIFKQTDIVGCKYYTIYYDVKVNSSERINE